MKAFSLHPGAIWTGLSKFMTPEDVAAFEKRVQNVKRLDQGAAATVWCAVSGQLDAPGGVYCEDCNVARAVPADSQELSGVRPWATDPALAERLWVLSEEITGLRVA